MENESKSVTAIRKNLDDWTVTG